MASRTLLLAALLASVALLACAVHPGGVKAASSVGVAEPPLHAMVIAHPLDHWAKAGFVEMAPTVRMSLPAGGDAVTRVYLRIPEGGVVSLRAGSRDLMFPPGTAGDRVSYVRGGRFIDDVRGTRWDERGREWFHVYLPSSAAPDAELDGVEWRRDDRDEERRATDWLVAWGRTHRSPADGTTMDGDEEDRFRMLNHCQGCHLADKPEATSDDDDLPPWPTDARGLYVPQAVFASQAILSTSSAFDDPNEDDPFVSIRCPSGRARLHGEPGRQWLTCRSGLPVGERDLAAAMKAHDAYAVRTCAARRYLFAHMDDATRAVFAPTVRMCP